MQLGGEEGSNAATFNTLHPPSHAQYMQLYTLHISKKKPGYNCLIMPYYALLA